MAVEFELNMMEVMTIELAVCKPVVQRRIYLIAGPIEAITVSSCFHGYRSV